MPASGQLGQTREVCGTGVLDYKRFGLDRSKQPPMDLDFLNQAGLCAAAEAGRIGAWSVDFSTDALTASEICRRIFGREDAAPFSRAAFDAAVHPGDRRAYAAAWATSLKTGADFDIDVRIFTPAGEPRWIALRARPAPATDDTPARMTGIVLDVTKAKQANAAMRDDLAQVQLILNSTAEGFYAVDNDGTTKLCNPAFLRMLGFASEAEAVGLKLHDIIHHTHPDGAHYAVDDCPIFNCAKGGPPAHVADELFYRLDGTSLPVEYWVHPIVVDDVRHGAICTFLDVTERKRAAEALRASEAQFRSLAQAMPNHVWTAAADGLLDWFNDRIFEYSGMKAPALRGDGWTAIVHPEDLPAAAARWASSLASGAQYETEFRLRRADGVYRWHIARAAALRGDDGRIARWVGSNTDIEDQKTAAAALTDLNAQLEVQVAQRTGELMAAEASLRQAQKMEAVGQLTGGIAHDFNNLLTGIIGSLDILRRRLGDQLPEETTRFIDAASTSAQRAAALTHRLLAFARRQSLDSKPEDVNASVAGMEDLLRRTLGEQIEFESSLHADLWLGLTDLGQLDNALLNLAINARDAMPDGGKLTIETANTRLDEGYAAAHEDVTAGDYVVISVSDTGVGMPAEVMARAFDPFFTTKPIGQGTGLGLSMIYGFMKQSGGHIRIYSEPGHGTTVKLFLRRAYESSALPMAAAAAPAPRGQGETVLLVEDDATVRMLVVDVLEELGYRYLVAHDGTSALALLDIPRIDLLVTDVGLPNMNGRQLAEIARQRRPGLKVLFITGYAENAAVRGGFLAPGMEMMTKPFALDALGAKIRQLIET